MEITNVRVKLLFRDDTKIKALAGITIDDCFVVTGLKIIEGRNGYFVAMPSDDKKNEQNVQRPGEKQKRFDLAFPTNNDTRLMIQQKVLEAYEETLDKAVQNNTRSPYTPRNGIAI